MTRARSSSRLRRTDDGRRLLDSRGRGEMSGAEVAQVLAKLDRAARRRPGLRAPGPAAVPGAPASQPPPVPTSPPPRPSKPARPASARRPRRTEPVVPARTAETDAALLAERQRRDAALLADLRRREAERPGSLGQFDRALLAVLPGKVTATEAADGAG